MYSSGLLGEVQLLRPVFAVLEKCCKGILECPWGIKAFEYCRLLLKQSMIFTQGTLKVVKTIYPHSGNAVDFAPKINGKQHVLGGSLLPRMFWV